MPWLNTLGASGLQRISSDFLSLSKNNTHIPTCTLQTCLVATICFSSPYWANVILMEEMEEKILNSPVSVRKVKWVFSKVQVSHFLSLHHSSERLSGKTQISYPHTSFSWT